MSSQGSKRFEKLLRDFFERVFIDDPIFATHSGRRDGEGKLPRATLDFEKQTQRRRLRTLGLLASISPADLSSPQHLDRLALRSRLLRESDDFERGRHRLEPNAIEQVLNILLHELQRTEKDRLRAERNIRSLLRQTPRFLNEAGALIDRPERVWRRVMEQTAAGADSFFQAVSAFLNRANPPERKSQRTEVGPKKMLDAKLIASARRAVWRYRKCVLARPVASEGSFAIGPEKLQRRVRDELGLDLSLKEIESLAHSEIARIAGLLEKACRRFGKHRRPEIIIEAARSKWRPPEDLVGFYERETSRICLKFRRARAVSFPGREQLLVRLVPEFMRHLFPTAAYSSPGAFEREQRGIFRVNDLGATKASEHERRAERQQHFGLSLTCAHEAYPGHHLQFTTANRHPRRWRRLFAHSIFYEGWTLWCEQMMVDLKIDPAPWIRIQQLHDALWRCHRILVDLRLQTRRYTYEQGVRHMQKHLGFTRSRAEADVNWYTASPGVPMSYWLGRLENARLARRLMVGRGWSLRRFNDWLLSFGTLPQGWIEKYGLD